jgi:hypothetical protein
MSGEKITSAVGSRTPVCDVLGIDHPIVQDRWAGRGMSPPALVASIYL